MHNIKYVISVDDCFLECERKTLEAAVFSKMIESIEPFEEVVLGLGKDDFFTEIEVLKSQSVDVSERIRDFVEALNLEQLERCYELCEADFAVYKREKEDVLNFLDGLKNQGIIERYFTFSSTSEASKFDLNSAGLTNIGIVWLLDRNFIRAEESEDAGLVFAQNLIQRGGDCNYIYMLTANECGKEEEDEIEVEFDKVLSDNCITDTQSFIYYISKRRLNGNNIDRVAKSLAQGFKRKICYELFQLFNNCMNEGIKGASDKVKNIRQKTLNYLFTDKVSGKGESYIEAVARLVRIFYQDEFNKEISRNHDTIAEKAKYFEELCTELGDNVGNANKFTSILKEYRDIELYNNHVNKQHSEITTGDIFKIHNSYYILVSQACDTYLRKNGSRKLEVALLLEIKDNCQGNYCYNLSCFLNMNKPCVDCRSFEIIPFELLDLCVFNDDGMSSLEFKNVDGLNNALGRFTVNYTKRFRNVFDKINEIKSRKILLTSFFDDNCVESKEKIKEAYEYLEGINLWLKNFEIGDNRISFPICRISRLNELTTVEIVNNYASISSRIGQPFDFLKSNDCSR